MATLNTASPTADFTLTAGGGRISLTAEAGAWGGVTARLYWAAAASPTVFNAFTEDGEHLEPFARIVNLKAADVLRVTISKPGGVPAATSVDATYLE